MRRKALIFGCALALAALGGVALASVRVYHNKFQDRSDKRDLELSGKGCEADLRKDKGQLGVTTEEGGSRCRLRLPVQADDAKPDQIVQVEAKLLPKTDEKVRKKVYVALTVREGGGGYYELRVYPEKRQYSLVRRPEDEAFPVKDTDRRIGKTGDKNTLTLRAIGNDASGNVNKVSVPATTDPAANDLKGTRLSMVLGQEGGSRHGAAVWFSDLSVRVPKP